MMSPRSNSFTCNPACPSLSAMVNPTGPPPTMMIAFSDDFIGGIVPWIPEQLRRSRNGVGLPDTGNHRRLQQVFARLRPVGRYRSYFVKAGGAHQRICLLQQP